MIGYTLVGSNDLDKAKTFYDDLFGAIGMNRLMEFPNGGCAWGADWTKPMFGVGKPYDGQAATFGNGAMVAIVVDERPKVDAIHERAIELGAKCEGGPGVGIHSADKHVMPVHHIAEDGQGSHAIDKHALAKHLLAHAGDQNMGDDADAGNDCDVDLGMSEEPEEMQPEQWGPISVRADVACDEIAHGKKESGSEMAVGEEQQQRSQQNAEADEHQ